MQLTILGAGGHAKTLKHMAEMAANYDRIRLVDKNEKVMDDKFDSDVVIIGIGNNQIRRDLYNEWSDYTAIFSAGSIYDPENVDGFGDGCQILHVGHIGPDVVIGANVIVNNGAIIEHGCTIGPHSHIAPGAILCGDVTIGEGVFVGAGAIITPGKKIESGEFIKAGVRV